MHLQQRINFKALITGLLAVTIIATSFARAFAVSSDPERPNIIFIPVDDQDPFEFGFFGGDVLTPNVDRIAQAGLYFPRFHLAASICSPSRYTFFTGQYASRGPTLQRQKLDYGHENVWFGRTHKADSPSLPTVMKDAGYITGFCGKIDGFISAPISEELREIGVKNLKVDNPEHDRLLKDYQRVLSQRLKDLYGFDYAESLDNGNNVESWGDFKEHNQAWTTKGAIDFIDAYHDANQPFFLYWSPMTLHGRSPLGDDHRRTHGGLIQGLEDVQPSLDEVKRRVEKAGKTNPLVTWVDDGLGAILTQLEEHDILDNTVIIYTSDNGGAGGKGSCYNKGTNVPLIIYWKGITDGRGRHLQDIDSADIVATIFGLARATPPADMVLDGQSLAPVVLGQVDQIPPRPAYSEVANTRMVSMNGWKYITFRLPRDVLLNLPPGYTQNVWHIWNPYSDAKHIGLTRPVKSMHPAYDHADQLYHVAEDWNEQNNLAADPAYAEKLAEMKKLMSETLRDMPGSYGQFRFEVEIRDDEVDKPRHIEGDLDLSEGITTLAIAEGSTPTLPHYTIISYTGQRQGRFADVDRVKRFGYRVDYSTPGEVRLLAQRKDAPRSTAGTQAIEFFDYGDRWNEAKVYSVADVEGLTMGSVKVPETKYGGRADRKAQATGFFRVEKIDGRWWFIDPDGGLFHATGINGLGARDAARTQERIDRDVALLRKAGFNAVHISINERAQLKGIDIRMPYCCNLMLTFSHLVDKHSGDKRIWDAPPLWDDAVREAVEKRARDTITPYTEDPYLIGFFTDNEMHWPAEALDHYYDLHVNDAPYEVVATRWGAKGQKYTIDPKDFRSYQLVADWVQSHGFEPNENGEFSWEARQKFQTFQAEQYAKIISESIRKVDPSHLILSARHLRQDGQNPGMFRGLGKHFDAIGMNYYGAWPPDPVVLDAWERWSGRPTFISEFSAQSFDTIPRQARDAFIVHGQEDRGKYYQNAVLATLQNNNCVGTLWFCFADMAPPREANYGIVSADGVPYNDFLKYCWEVNSHRYKLIDCLREHPLDLSDVYDPLRNVNWRDRFEVFDD